MMMSWDDTARTWNLLARDHVWWKFWNSWHFKWIWRQPPVFNGMATWIMLSWHRCAADLGVAQSGVLRNHNNGAANRSCGAKQNKRTNCSRLQRCAKAQARKLGPSKLLVLYVLRPIIRFCRQLFWKGFIFMSFRKLCVHFSVVQNVVFEKQIVFKCQLVESTKQSSG